MSCIYGLYPATCARAATPCARAKVACAIGSVEDGKLPGVMSWYVHSPRSAGNSRTILRPYSPIWLCQFPWKMHRTAWCKYAYTALLIRPPFWKKKAILERKGERFGSIPKHDAITPSYIHATLYLRVNGDALASLSKGEGFSSKGGCHGARLLSDVH